PYVCDREGIPDILERPWVGGLTVASANHRLVIQAESNPETRQQQARTSRGPAVRWHAAQTSSENLPCGRVEPVDAGVIFRQDRNAFPAQPVDQRKPANLPVITRVKRVLLPINRVRVAELVDLSRCGRVSQQEVRPAMKLLALGDAARVALEACSVAAEAE